jgi:hypothetical protein
MPVRHDDVKRGLLTVPTTRAYLRLSTQLSLHGSFNLSLTFDPSDLVFCYAFLDITPRRWIVAMMLLHFTPFFFPKIFTRSKFHKRYTMLAPRGTDIINGLDSNISKKMPSGSRINTTLSHWGVNGGNRSLVNDGEFSSLDSFPV